MSFLVPAIEFLAATPLFLLFAVITAGYLLGKIEVHGVGLGVAAILFAGLGIGALDPRLRLPEIVQVLGLVLFVYAVGLSSGPGFFSTLRRHGLRNAALAGAAILVAAGVIVAGSRVLGFGREHAAGLLAGGLTNTPSLAAVLELLHAGGNGTPPAATEAASARAVLAYSVAYPIGVLGPILVIALLLRGGRRRGDDARASHEWPAPAAPGRTTGGLRVVTALVTNDGATGVPIGTLREQAGGHLTAGRIRRASGRVELALGTATLSRGDLVTAIGRPQEIAAFVDLVGEESREAIDLDRSELDYRRIFVSSPEVAGHSLRELDLPQQFGALVTAVRRGDADWVPDGDTVLQLGDRVRVLTRRESMQAVTRFFGDSYRAVSEVDVLTFSVGIALGIAIGLVPIPLPGGITIELGLAGGPLLVAMILGALGRTGPLVWGIPYGANLTLRQVGLVLFFAGVGTRNGYATVRALADPATLGLLATGAVATLLAATTIALVGRRLMRAPAGLVTGMIAGIHTQPAALAFAVEQRGDEAPNVGYAAVYPFATLFKLILAQLLVALW